MTQEIPAPSTSTEFLSAEQARAEKEAREYVQKLKAFYVHLITYLVTLAFLLVVNLMVSPGYLWVKWAALGWGIGIVVHGLAVFEISMTNGSANKSPNVSIDDLKGKGSRVTFR